MPKITKEVKNSFWAGFFYTAVAVLSTYPLILKLSRGIYGPFFDTDIRGTVWFSWWYTLSHHLGIDWHFCPYLAAPFGLDFSAIPFFWMSLSLTKSLSILTSPVIALNALLLISFVACGLLTYTLVRRMTGDPGAALLAGFIFTFSPYHLNKVMEFSYAYLGTFLVFYVYSLLRLRERVCIRSTLVAGAAFALLLDFNAYYAYFAVLLTAAFFLFCLFYQWKVKIVEIRNREGTVLALRLKNSLKFLLSVGCVFSLAFLIQGPVLFKIVGRVFSGPPAGDTSSSAIYLRSFSYLFAQSARPLSYLLPASSHPVFGEFTKKMFGSFFYGRGPIEQTLYLGWIPLALSFIAFRVWKKKRLEASSAGIYAATQENFVIGFFLFSGIIMFLCSMPPYFDLGLFKVYFPSFFLYKVFPMFRAYARCGVFVMLSVSVLAGFAISFIVRQIRKPFQKYALFLFLALGIAFEYTNIPPWRATDIYARTPAVYKWLASQPEDLLIAEYPMATAVAGEASENYDYLFYQTLHGKKLVNGAQPGSPAFKVREEIARIDSPGTALVLRSLSVRYVIVHTKRYITGQFKTEGEIVGVLPDLEGARDLKLIGAFGDDLLYEINLKKSDS